MRKPWLVLLSFAVLTAVPRPAAAWGFEAHKYITARAIALLPQEIRPYFEKYQAGIVEHSTDPDLWRTAGWTRGAAAPLRRHGRVRAVSIRGNAARVR